MAEERIRELLAQLHAELEKDPPDDPATLELARKVDEDIHKALEQGEGHGLGDQLTEAATRFEAEHPTAGGVLREVLNTLARMGI